MFAAFTQSLALVLTPMGLLSILGGVLCGIFVGVMPGLSSVMGMSIMLPVALSLYSTGQNATNYSVLLAGAVLVITPILLLFVFLQRYFIQGVAMTGIK